MRTFIDFERIAASRLYDLAMRLPIALYAALLAMMQVMSLVGYLAADHEAISALELGANIASRVALGVFLATMCLITIGRERPVGKSAGWEPRVTAMLGAFLSLALVLFPRHELSAAGATVSAMLIVIGNALAIFVILHLGRSFSVMAEARRLVTSGPYGIVRHPLYVAEQIAIIGAFLQFQSVWTALLLIVQFAFQLRRMRLEEAVLAESFPEYEAYRRRTPRLVPGLRWMRAKETKLSPLRRAF
jgi:protein-S-isoprenylcysteine O-methyltransferase Ste14